MRSSRRNLAFPRKPQFSAIFCNWHGGCNIPGMTAGWSGGQVQGRYKMIYANLHQIALSIVGALVASSVFLSAAVSSAPVI
jgi:hypothetical protein